MGRMHKFSLSRASWQRSLWSVVVAGRRKRGMKMRTKGLRPPRKRIPEAFLLQPGQILR